MKYYLVRLLAPRATFRQDMTAEERTMMQEHVAYWRSWMAKGNVVVFGPVADPAWPLGIGVLRLDDGVDPAVMWKGDPVMRPGTGFRIEVLPMLTAVVAGS